MVVEKRRGGAVPLVDRPQDFFPPFPAVCSRESFLRDSDTPTTTKAGRDAEMNRISAAYNHDGTTYLLRARHLAAGRRGAVP